MTPASEATLPVALTDDELCPPAEEPTTPSTPPAWAEDVDRSIANATLLPKADYSPSVFDAPLTSGVRFDADVAAAIPECRADLDVVFETERHGAITATKSIWSVNESFFVFQYIAVLPDEQAAAAMAAALADPAFRAGCLQAYGEQLAPGGVMPVLHPHGYIPFVGVPCDDPNPPFPEVGDASSVACFDRTWIGAPQDGLLPGQLFDVATIQVGRTVVVMDIARRIFDQEVATDEDVERIMATLADRADRALQEAGER
jgi:hypothetical protein